MKSNKEFYYLNTKEEFEINSLNEYKEIVTSDEFKDTYFRGEPCNYLSTNASAFRNGVMEGLDNLSNTSFDSTNAVLSFKNEVWHRITLDERANFLAFCQHHGIPTNLIDISTSPLVALYFACQPSTYEHHKVDNNIGVVDIYSNSAIDITDIIEDIGIENFLYKVLSDEDIQLRFYNKLLKYEEQYPYEFYKIFKSLNTDIYHNILNPKKEISSNYFSKDFYDYNDGEYKNNYDFAYLLSDIKDNLLMLPIFNKTKNLDTIVKCYLTILNKLLFEIYYNNIMPHNLNCLPNLIYRPLMTFDRGLNQHSLFLFQSYLYCKDDMYDYDNFAHQRMWIDRSIIINNKEQILKDLDFYGINRKYIFNDYDNIAKYIVENLEKKKGIFYQ